MLDSLAIVSLGLGDRDQALSWLEQGFQERSPWLSVHPHSSIS